MLKQLSLGKTKKYPRESIKELIQMKMRCLYFTQSETEQLQMLYNEYGRISTLQELGKITRVPTSNLISF